MLTLTKAILQWQAEKLYTIEGQTAKKQQIVLKVVNRSDKAVLEDILKK